MIVKCVFKKGKRISFVIMLLMALSTSNLVSAQNGSTVSGVVKDEAGMPMPGVNVLEKGSKSSASSDFDGKFSINVSSDKAVLLFSYIGYETKSVNVTGNKVLNVSLNPNSESLNEVKIVSFGYGTIKKENLTGAVSSMSAKELSKIPVTNVAEAMAGRLAGVSVQTVDGAPGADIVIRVRGGGSLTQDNSPLYVVDGFVVENLNNVPPGDIASIDILKDAATTAIYGAQGANGVVVVTTKKPKAGKTTVTFNQYMQIGVLPKDRKYEVLSPYEFVSMQYEKAKMSTTSSNNPALTSFEKYFGKYDDLELYKSKAPKDWQQEALGKPVVSYYTNLSVSGGSETTKFIFSYSANNDEGLMVGSGEKRNAINFKLNHDISKKLRIDLSARISNREIDGAGSSGEAQMRIKNILTSRPTNGIADELVFDPNSLDDDDQYEQFLLGMRSPAEIIAQDWKQRKLTNYTLNAGISWNILDNLLLKSALTTEKGYGENLRFYGPETGESKQNGNSLPLGVKTDAETDAYRLVNTLNYNFKNIGKHDLSLMLGHEVRSKGGKGQSIRVEDFRLTMRPEEMFANLSLGRVDNQSTVELTDENWYSLFLRGDYAYDDKYLFTATVRRDVSSKFEGDNNVAIFPALSAGWKISSEPFMKDSKIFNELKLRIGYGEVGNDRIPVNSTKLLMEPSTVKGPGFGTNANNVYYNIIGTTLYNPELIWETTLTRNVGLDFRLFNSVINGSLEFYRNTTTDLLFKALAYKVTGFVDQWKNIGATSNRGVELSLNANIIDKKDFSLGLTANFGINKGKIDELDGTTMKAFVSNWASTDLMSAEDYRLEIGKSVGMIYGFVNDGMYTVDDFTQATPTSAWVLKSDVPSNSGILGAPVRPGSMKLKDLNGDGAITVDDRQVIGKAVPKAQGGFGVNTTYKGFDLSMFFNWSYGNDVYNTGKIDYNQLYRTTYGNMLNTMNSADRFTYIDTYGTYGTPGSVVTNLAQLGEMNQGKTLWSGNMSFGDARPVLTDWAIEDGSYIRLNNVTLGYTLPMQDFKKTIFSSARIYVTGTNLALWTKYSGYDPDVNSNRNDGSFSALTPGLDYSSYPRSRRFTVGINLTF